MGEDQIKLTVYFEEPFWVGVFEKIEAENYPYPKLLSVLNRKIMRYMSSF